MSKILEQFQQWQLACGETRSLLERNGELLDRRAQLLRTASAEFHSLARVAHDFADQVSEADQEPATRSTSPRSR